MDESEELGFLANLIGEIILRGAGGFLVDGPEGVGGVAGVFIERGRGNGAARAEVPAFDEPAGFRIDGAQRSGLIGRAVGGGQAGLGGFADEEREEVDEMVGVIEMPVAGFGKHGNGGERMLRAEGEGGGEAVVVPFVFTHDHEAGHAVDVSLAPVRVRLAAAGAVGEWRIAVDGENGERARGIPGGEIPRVRRAGGMAEGDDGGEREFGVTGFVGEGFHEGFEAFARAFVEEETSVEGRRDPDFSDAEAGEFFAQGGVFEDAAFDHVVLADDDGADAFATVGNPEKCTAVAHRHGPLPDARGSRGRHDGDDCRKDGQELAAE